MRIDYQQRLQPVIRQLERHYRDPPDLAHIAALAALSPYHFHRIFSAVTGETLAAYLRRLRLENVARQLFYGRAPITALALEHGYGSSQALAKAFRAHFGISVSELRRCTDLPSYIALMRHSKIGHHLHKDGHAANGAAPHTGSEGEPKSVMDLNTENFAPRTLAYVRVIGPYGQGYDVATNRLYRWASAHGLAGGERLFIYHDSPEVTPAARCRTDIGLSVPPATTVSGAVERQELAGGSYAFIRRRLTAPAQHSRCWQELLSQVVAAGLAVAERPCFERYHHFQEQPYRADVSFYVAVVL